MEEKLQVIFDTGRLQLFLSGMRWLFKSYDAPFTYLKQIGAVNGIHLPAVISVRSIIFKFVFNRLIASTE